MERLTMITARGGSKRIPGKNIKHFCGKPILWYSIRAALDSGMFSEVMVSTDDEEIAACARACGAVVPFFRSEETSGDFASTDDVIAEVLQEYEQRGRHFEQFCCIYPTAPFITADRLTEAMKMLESAESVTPVTEYSYPPQRSFVIRDERLVRRFPEYAYTRSQDLERFYHDAGQFYCCRTDAFFREHTTDVADMAALILPESEVQDIDTPNDWKMAEEKYERLHPQHTGA